MLFCCHKYFSLYKNKHFHNIIILSSCIKNNSNQPFILLNLQNFNEIFLSLQ